MSNKHVIIFGATSGIGFATAIACIEAKMDVSICARRESKLAQIANGKPNVFYKNTDITNKDEVDSFINDAILANGNCDFVINCAGVMYYQSMQKADYNEWLSMVNTNIIGFLNITQAILNPLMASKGMFVNITSDAGRQAFPGLCVYSGTKSFMEFTIRGLRHEMIEHGVRFINLQPGNVATPLQDMSSDNEAVQLYGSENNNNFLVAEDIAKTILFAMAQPKNVAINEILIEPQHQPI